MRPSSWERPRQSQKPRRRPTQSRKGVCQATVALASRPTRTNLIDVPLKVWPVLRQLHDRNDRRQMLPKLWVPKIGRQPSVEVACSTTFGRSKRSLNCLKVLERNGESSDTFSEQMRGGVKVTSFLACAYGNLTVNGLVDLGGIGFDKLSVPQLPSFITLKFFARCESEMGDLPGPHTAELKFMGEDAVINKTAVKFITTEEKRNQHLLVDLGLQFDSEGLYRVDLAIDGKPGASWPLQVELLSGQTPPPA